MNTAQNPHRNPTGNAISIGSVVKYGAALRIEKKMVYIIWRIEMENKQEQEMYCLCVYVSLSVWNNPFNGFSCMLTSQ